MRIITRIVQYLVGILFIVSGLVKANDPLGLSYKMKEFLELWSSSVGASNFFAKDALISFFDLLHHQSLALSVIMITLEIAAGVALIIGWSRRFVLWLLLVLIVFFTFLTGYAFLSGKFTNCGCFGDCLPITPFASFIKDLVLLVLILFLLTAQRFIRPYFTASIRSVVVLISIFISLALQWYVLKNLPLVDCLPFRKGNNIAEQMKPPPGSMPDSIAMRFIYEKEGKRYEFAPENLPADFNTYKYVDRIDKVVRKGNAEPKIKGFSLIGFSGEDSTDAVLNAPLALVLFCNEVNVDGWINNFRDVVAEAQQKNIPVYVASAAARDWAPVFGSKQVTGVQYFNTDFTIVRTVARTNPTLLVLKKGRVVEKYSRGDLAKAKADVAAGKFQP
ncbi:MAG: BT_3928 family protein [Flavisolibacter sp.]